MCILYNKSGPVLYSFTRVLAICTKRFFLKGCFSCILPIVFTCGFAIIESSNETNNKQLRKENKTMKKTTELYYTFRLYDGILDIKLNRSTFWDNIHLSESYEENYIHLNFFASHYYQSFGNIENKKNYTVFDYYAQRRR